MTAATILWFRRDLRLSDNPALTQALREANDLIPVFIFAPDEEGQWPIGSASRWWLHRSLKALDESLRKLGSELVIRRGSSLEALRRLIRETGAQRVFWNRLYEPCVIERDKTIKQVLREDGLTVESFNSALVREPWEITRGKSEPFKVFTPYWKALQAQGIDQTILPAPAALPPLPSRLASLSIEDLELSPRIQWDDGLRENWRPGELGAMERLEEFLDGTVCEYALNRDRPDMVGTSRLSPHLHFGEIGPRQIVWSIQNRLSSAGSQAGSESFIRELAWREFAHHLLFHFPYTPEHPLDERFRDFPWFSNRNLGRMSGPQFGTSDNYRHALAPSRKTVDSKGSSASREAEFVVTGGHLAAWQEGKTGIPLVDAGMRELWRTGWMHNRVRMVTASFLVKNLGIHWLEGAAWFWDTLVDADLANNTLGWQWVAGCGADAAPYFRIFNPVLQGQRFDPEGGYVRRWIPEIARLPDGFLHRPWEAPSSVLESSGVRPGQDYPLPIVDLKESREWALSAYKHLGGKDSQKA